MLDTGHQLFSMFMLNLNATRPNFQDKININAPGIRNSPIKFCLCMCHTATAHHLHGVVSVALHGKFYLNKADVAPLEFPGVGTFPAFSGNNEFKNQPGCTHVKNNGALPAGKYWIVPRPLGGMKTQAATVLADLYTRNNHSEWFALYRNDGVIDDYTWINSVRRGNFRLHPVGKAGISLGCVTLYRKSDYQTLYNMLLNTQLIAVPGTKLQAYGTIEVVGYEKHCPYIQ